MAAVAPLRVGGDFASVRSCFPELISYVRTRRFRRDVASIPPVSFAA